MDEATKFWYLFIAYDIVWLLIGGYVVWLGVRQNRIQRQIERLRALLGEEEDDRAEGTAGRAS
ncbi:MAG TPA: CcmD family protein [Candidatus Polarisedimenticolia bacterium]|nr:CcmD family protein [Candidatus Polarisedimenticolia bacterium]